MSSPLSTIARYPSATRAHMLKAFLAAHGIHCQILDEAPQACCGGKVEVSVRVPASEAERARQWVAEFEKDFPV